MTPLNSAPEVFGLFVKAARFENGAFLFFGAAASKPFTDLINILFQGVEMKSFLLPFVVAAISFFIYLMAYGLDFWSGLRAARHEANGKAGYIKSDKLWSSIYKLVAILIIMLALCVFAFVFLLLEVTIVYKFFLYSIAAVGVMAFLFDMHSVGENYKRRFQQKPKLFDWLDGMAATINETLTSKIKNIFK